MRRKKLPLPDWNQTCIMLWAADLWMLFVVIQKTTNTSNYASLYIITTYLLLQTQAIMHHCTSLPPTCCIKGSGMLRLSIASMLNTNLRVFLIFAFSSSSIFSVGLPNLAALVVNVIEQQYNWQIKLNLYRMNFWCGGLMALCVSPCLTQIQPLVVTVLSAQGSKANMWTPSNIVLVEKCKIEDIAVLLHSVDKCVHMNKQFSNTFVSAYLGVSDRC